MSDLIENLKAKLLHSTELIQQIASEQIAEPVAHQTPSTTTCGSPRPC